MRDKSHVLVSAVNMTTLLLLAGGLGVVVATFDQQLGWDILPARLEAALTALVISCATLAAVGVAISLVTSAHETVRNTRAMASSFGEVSEREGKSRRKSWMATGFVLATFVSAPLVLGILNTRVEHDRQRKFKELAAEQFQVFSPRFVSQLQPITEPPRQSVPRGLHELVSSIDDLPFVERCTLYLPDHADSHAMWGYTAWRSYQRADGFARFYLTKPFEKAMRSAVDGNAAELQAQNEEPGFAWFGEVKGGDGKVLGILRIDANSSEDFHSY